jgi:hypothetical protein
VKTRILSNFTAVQTAQAAQRNKLQQIAEQQPMSAMDNFPLLVTLVTFIENGSVDEVAEWKTTSKNWTKDDKFHANVSKADLRIPFCAYDGLEETCLRFGY